MPHIAVTAIGADRPGIVAALTGALHDLGGNLEDVSSTILRGHFAMMLVADVPASTTEADAALSRAAAPLGVRVHVADVESGAPDRPRATHVVTVYGSDRPGIVAAVSEALAGRDVNVADLQCRRTSGDQPIYAMVAEVVLPSGADAAEVEAALREVSAEVGVDLTFAPIEVETL